MYQENGVNARWKSDMDFREARKDGALFCAVFLCAESALRFGGIMMSDGAAVRSNSAQFDFTAQGISQFAVFDLRRPGFLFRLLLRQTGLRRFLRLVCV